MYIYKRESLVYNNLYIIVKMRDFCAKTEVFNEKREKPQSEFRA